MDSEEAMEIFRNIQFTEFEIGFPEPEALRGPGIVLLCRENQRTAQIYRWGILEHRKAAGDAMETARNLLKQAPRGETRHFAQIAVFPDQTALEVAFQAVDLVCRPTTQ